jgi:hypothetical protein
VGGISLLKSERFTVSSARIALLALTLSGCHAYHTRLFATQDQEPTLDEPYLTETPGAGGTVLAQGSLSGVAKKKGNSGEVALIAADGVQYIRLTDWQALEAPDLFFYLSGESSEMVAADKKTILQDPERAVKLTANNLRPSNLGFAGEETWFVVPDGFADPASLHVYCLKYNELFASAALE